MTLWYRRGSLQRIASQLRLTTSSLALLVPAKGKEHAPEQATALLYLPFIVGALRLLVRGVLCLNQFANDLLVNLLAALSPARPGLRGLVQDV